MNEEQYIQITRCPYCGANKLKISSLLYQIWEVSKIYNGKVGKAKKDKCPYGEEHFILTCQNCNDLYIEADDLFKIEEGKILIDKDYYEDLIVKLEENKDE